VFETVADVDGTEKILESTANGTGNYFHTGCIAALTGDDEYELIFIPWYWQTEYRAKLPSDFKATDKECELKSFYNLDDQQLQWRRNKISAFQKDGHNGERKFKQEYPCSPAEAFQASGNPLIDSECTTRARKSNITDKHAPLVLGVDPAPLHDRTTIAWRRGRQLIKIEAFNRVSQMELAGKLALRVTKNPDIKKIFIDVAEGRGCIDRLGELGFGDIVTGVPFSQAPNDDEVYANKRSEMAGLLKNWLEDELGVSIPDDDALEFELGAIPAFKTTSNGRNQLVPKDEIIKTYGRSPDLFDAFMLTFAQPVRSDYNQNQRIRKKFERKQSELSVTNRRRGIQKARDEEEYDDYDDNGPDGKFRTVRSGFRRK
jgi:hypothetical protein